LGTAPLERYRLAARQSVNPAAAACGRKLALTIDIGIVESFAAARRGRAATRTNGIAFAAFATAAQMPTSGCARRAGEKRTPTIRQHQIRSAHPLRR